MRKTKTLMSLPPIAPRPQLLRKRGSASVGDLPDVKQLSEYCLGDSLPRGIEDSGLVGGLPSEGYRLSLRKGRFFLAYADSAGAFYGVQTLRQVLQPGTPGAARKIPEFDIEDWPDLENRGFLLDISRLKVPTMETLRELVELMSLLKLNQLQLYTEHTFAYQEHRVVWEGHSPITGEEIEELDGWCRERNIELVPNQNSFGHMRPWLIHDEYKPLAEAPEGFRDPWGNWRDYPYSLSPAVPGTLDFLGGLYDELLPHFTSQQLNVGCDETFDLGQGRSKELCRRKGTGEVYLDYLLDIHELVSRRQRRMLFYADIVQEYPETISRLPKDAIAIEWGYEAAHPFGDHCRRLAEAGLEFYVAPGTATWNSLAGRWGVAKENIYSALQAAHRYGASGMLLTEWGDNGYLQPLITMVAPLVYAATGAWNRAGLSEEPWEWLTHHYLEQESARQVAGALRDMAELYRLYPGPIHNASVFGIALQLRQLPMYREQLPLFDLESRAKAKRELQRIGDTLQEMESAPGKAEHQLKEVRLAHSLLEVSLATLEEGAGNDFDLCLDSLNEEYAACWNSRYRPGGYSASVAFLEALSNE